MKFFFAFTAAALLSTSVNANEEFSNLSPSRRFLKRAPACNADNCLRGLKNPTASVYASTLCTGLIQSTATVQETRTITFHVTQTATPAVEVITESITATETSSTTTTTTIAIENRVYTVAVDRLLKRAPPPSTSRLSVDIYAQCGAQPSRVSSACSCLVTPSPTTVTTTLIASHTVTGSTTLVPERSTTEIVISTITINDIDTVTVTATTTTSSSTSSTSEDVPPEPTYTRACPDADGKRFRSLDGTAFRVHCKSISQAGNILAETNEAAFERCIDRCAGLDGCRSADFFRTASRYHDNCFLRDGYYAAYVFGETGHDFAGLESGPSPTP